MQSVQSQLAELQYQGESFNESWYFKVADIEIKEPLELEEAWTYLDIFPSTTIAEISGAAQIAALTARVMAKENA